MESTQAQREHNKLHGGSYDFQSDNQKTPSKQPEIRFVGDHYLYIFLLYIFFSHSSVNSAMARLSVGFNSNNKETFRAYLAFFGSFSVFGWWKSPKQSWWWSAPPARWGSGWWWDSKAPASLGRWSTLDQSPLDAKVQISVKVIGQNEFFLLQGCTDPGIWLNEYLMRRNFCEVIEEAASSDLPDPEPMSVGVSKW